MLARERPALVALRPTDPRSPMRLSLARLLLAAGLGAGLGAAPLATAAAQRVDTLQVPSAAFGGPREVRVHLPEGYQYVGPAAPMPVLIVLDGQHPWMERPVRAIIDGLVDTKELPWLITVVVPHDDRVREARMPAPGSRPAPLLTFLADELPQALKAYHASDLRILIGHSFTASFALHALTERPDAFSAALAHTPLDGIATTLPRVHALLRQRPDRAAMISVGGAERWADFYHARALLPLLDGDSTWRKLPNFRWQVADHARHNAVPVRATPDLLAWYFGPFANRDTLLAVNDEYVLRSAPPPVERMLAELDASFAFRGTVIPWQLPDIAGVASRLETGPYPQHTEAVYHRGVALYPGYFYFHAALGELVATRDARAARQHFSEALRLLDLHERYAEDYTETRAALLERLRP